MSKKNWMKIHTYLSLFFLPMCLIYAITGVGYIFGLKENAGATIHTINITSPLQDNLEEMMIEILKANNLKIPKNTTVRIQKGNPIMGNLKYIVFIQKDKNGQMVLRTIERNFYGILLLLHKAKGAVLFDILAICFSISLLIFYLSGLIVTSFCKKYRKLALITLFGGFIITFIAIFLSI